MNYGYIGLEKLELEPADEANRIFIELYQLTLGDTDLTGKDASGLTKDLRRHCPEMPSITVRPEGKGVTSALFEEEKG
jgi:hypothetical protein